jgi:hypothetical protein
MEADDGGHVAHATKSRLKGFLINGDHHENSSTAAPIADLYPQCTSLRLNARHSTHANLSKRMNNLFIPAPYNIPGTVFFGDICGFT